MVILFYNGWLHAEGFVEVIGLDAGWLCCRHKALSYDDTGSFLFIFCFYLNHVSSASVDAAQMVIKPP